MQYHILIMSMPVLRKLKLQEKEVILELQQEISRLKKQNRRSL